VRPVLAGSHDPVDLSGCGVVAADGLGGFGREPDFVLIEDESVRTTQSAQLNRGQTFLIHQVDYGERVEGSEAVVGDIGSVAVCRRDHFVRVVTHGDCGQHVEIAGIDDGKRVVLFGQGQQGRCGGGLGVGPTCDCKRRDQKRVLPGILHFLPPLNGEV
jgi:hypothetical protein